MAFTIGVFFVLFGISGLLTGAWCGSCYEEKGCCPQGWTQLDDHCYIFQYDERTFGDAESVCKLLGGNLASIHSYLENVVVAGLIREGGGDVAWIGLYDAIERGNLVWSDGTCFDFTNFAVGEPDGTGACFELVASEGSFRDENCTFYHPYVCIRDTDYCGHH